MGVLLLASPTVASPNLVLVARHATKALKLARAANTRSRRALVAAQQAGKTVSGSAGGGGAAGPQGPAGPPGPAGPAAATQIDFRADAGRSATVFNRGGLAISASCAAGPNLNVTVTSSVADSEVHVAALQMPASATTPTPFYDDNDHFGPTSNPLSLPTSNAQGTLTYSTPAGAVITVTFAAEQGAFSNTRACWFGGWATHSAP